LKPLKSITFAILLLAYATCAAQEIRLDGIKDNFSKKNWLKVSGGVSASGTCYYTNGTSYNTDKASYFLNGNVNFRICNLVNLPFSIHLTNTGSNYKYPTLPNRFSLHPSYKWATAHIGDVSMTFSPYTLSGHQFTGAGVELTPGKFKIAAMFGRMQRAVEYTPENDIVQAAYKRMGCGAMFGYEADRFRVNTSLFTAQDDETSLQWQPDSLGIRPQENLCANLELSVKVIKNLRLYGEYAISLMKPDTRADSLSSIHHYNAYKVGVDYTFLKNTIGISYERIDPDYQTLGAYYFNNDMENITVNFATVLFKDKLNFSANVGLQNDDVKNQKESKTHNFVGSANITYTPCQKLSLNASYTNFQTHENIKSQFDYINQYAPTENLDTLNFTQLSHNANLSIMWNIKQSDSQNQNLNVNVSYQIADDKYGSTQTPDTRSVFTNSSVSHTVSFVPSKTNLTSSVNFTQNNITDNNTYTVGPTMSVSTKFAKETLTLSASLSYNIALADKEIERNIANSRLGISYILAKKHTFALSGICQYQDRKEKSGTCNANATLSYNYNF